MGCDIHSMVERYYEPWTYRHKDYLTGKWEEQPYPGRWEAVKAPMWPNPYYNAERPIDEWNVPYVEEPLSSRNYFLFSWLADVRNDHIIPIAEPKGVPEDASKKWKKYVKKWGSDLHSTTYFTLTELEAAWEDVKGKTFTTTGVISVPQYIALRDRGVSPDSWSGWTSAPTLSSAEYESLSVEARASLPTGDWAGQHIRTDWEIPYVNSLGVIEDLIKGMRVLLGYRTSTDYVRVVMGFDN